MPYRKLYHWSPRANRLSIRKSGLLTTESKGCSYKVWLCTREELVDVLKHLCDHHKLTWTCFDLWEVKVDSALLRKTSVEGRFTVGACIAPESLRQEISWSMFTAGTSSELPVPQPHKL